MTKVHSPRMISSVKASMPQSTVLDRERLETLSQLVRQSES